MIECARMTKRAISRVFIFAAIALIAATTTAQSGRRGKTGSPSPTTPSVSGPKPVEKKAEPAPRIQMVVGITGSEVFTPLPYYLLDTVLANCIRRLGEAEIVFPTSGGRDMNRSDAIKQAKRETVRYVVLLKLGDEYADANPRVRNNQNDLYVEYTIFEPETAKVKRSGRVHQHIYQTGRGGISLPTKNSPIYSEYAVQQAAREAADQILAAFDIKVRGEWPY